jgi:hypothetical protein
MVEHREELVKQLVRASKNGEVNQVIFLGGSINEVDKITSGKFEDSVEFKIKEIEDGSR